MGAWIETRLILRIAVLMTSHPIWVRGLKLISVNIKAQEPSLVAPYMGAWIETIKVEEMKKSLAVAPYMGAWIETKF